MNRTPATTARAQRSSTSIALLACLFISACGGGGDASVTAVARPDNATASAPSLATPDAMTAAAVDALAQDPDAAAPVTTRLHPTALGPNAIPNWLGRPDGAVRYLVGGRQGGWIRLRIDFANSSATALGVRVEVNGVPYTSMSLSPTGGWSTVFAITRSISVNPGLNTIELVRDGSAHPGVALASLSLSNEDLLSAPGWQSSVGGSTTYTVTAGEAGAAALNLRYANGSLLVGSTTVLVNGIAQGRITMPPTGAWFQAATAAPLIVSLSPGVNRVTLLRNADDVAIARFYGLQIQPFGASGSPPSSSPSQGPMPTPLTIAGKTPVGRIVARDGQIIENVHVSNPSGSCIVVNGVSNVIIRNSEIGPCGSEGNQNAQGVEITNASNITIERNVIHDVSSAVYAMDSRHPIVMDRNYVYNVRGPFPRGQMFQMNRVSGGSAPSRVSCNLSDAAPGRRYGVEHGVTNAGVEDHINLFESPGLPGADTLVAYNRLRGGHKTSRSGSGIMMGDYGGGRITARGNVVVDVANVGIGIAGGSDITVEDNLIYQNRDAGIYVNLGIMVWSVTGEVCSGTTHTVRGNRVWTFNSLGAQNSFWNAGNCGPVAVSGNTFGDASLGPSLFDQVPAPCR
jgi:hypothetical protein